MSTLKIMHLADIHIGMKFTSYPENLRRSLVQTRLDTLKRAIEFADENACDWVVVAGDLFENLKVSKRDIEAVYTVLNAFNGDRVLVLPGNHDYYDDTVTLWKDFSYFKSDKIVLLKSCEVYSFEVNNCEVDVYAAPCFKKHSSTNQLGWISEVERKPGALNVLVAHGSVREWSPDLMGNYFPMSLDEISQLSMDLTLLGHTHVPYPNVEVTSNSRIFNAGTHEPDGLDYSYEGACWLVELSKDSSVSAKRIPLGTYRFFDIVLACEEELTERVVLDYFKGFDLAKVISRISLEGYIDKDVHHMRHEVYKQLYPQFAYLEILDDGLKAKFTEETIEQTFTQGSLPYVFLEELLQQYGPETAHLAYELMEEVIKRD